MRIGHTIPPAASPIYIRDIINGFRGLFRGKKEIERFRSELTDFYGVKHCFLVSSGKAALTLILNALHGLQPDRDEVLIPAFCCYSVPSAIVRANLKVKLCDVDPDTLDFDYEQLKLEVEKLGSGEVGKGENHCQQTTNNIHEPAPNKQRTTNNTHADRLLAILPVHLFGLRADVERVRSSVSDPSVSIIEDSAQVLGSSWDGQKMGTIGDVGFFSLGRGKALSTVEGGIIITNRDDIAGHIADQYSRLKNYSLFELIGLIIKAVILILFQHPAFFWFPKSLPFLKVGDTFYDPDFRIRKLTPFQAGLARNWLANLNLFQKHRRTVAGQWKSDIKAGNIRGYCTKNGHMPDLLRFPVRIAEDQLWKSLLQESEKNGDGIMFTYPTGINGIEELKQHFKQQAYPGAEQLAKQLLTLPVHPYITSKDRDKINRTLKKYQ